MRSFRSCIGTVSPEAAARFRAFSLAMASPAKKSLRAAERKRADVARARRRWIREQGWLDTTRLVFIDDTAITTNMVRLNGWSPCGERLVADAPMGRWETVTFIAGLRRTGIVAPMVIKGAMNGESFLAYMEQCLARLRLRPTSRVEYLVHSRRLGLAHRRTAYDGQIATCLPSPFILPLWGYRPERHSPSP